jgi:hypothetical protein
MTRNVSLCHRGNQRNASLLLCLLICCGTTPCTQSAGHDHQGTELLIDLYDENGDHKLELEEVQDMMVASINDPHVLETAENATVLFGELDVNGDGYLNTTSEVGNLAATLLGWIKPLTCAAEGSLNVTIGNDVHQFTCGGNVTAAAHNHAHRRLAGGDAHDDHSGHADHGSVVMVEPEPSLMVGNIKWTCKEMEHTDSPARGTTASTASSWWAAIGFTCLISALSLAGAVVLPVKQHLDKITTVLVAFAAGAILGDAVLHLIPLSYGVDR